MDPGYCMHAILHLYLCVCSVSLYAWRCPRGKTLHKCLYNFWGSLEQLGYFSYFINVQCYSTHWEVCLGICSCCYYILAQHQHSWLADESSPHRWSGEWNINITCRHDTLWIVVSIYLQLFLETCHFLVCHFLQLFDGYSKISCCYFCFSTHNQFTQTTVNELILLLQCVQSSKKLEKHIMW